MEKVALPHLAVPVLEECQLVFGLDAFREHLHPQRMCHVDDRGNDRAFVGLAGDTPHEALVHLEFVDRQAAEIGQG